MLFKFTTFVTAAIVLSYMLARCALAEPAATVFAPALPAIHNASNAYSLKANGHDVPVVAFDSRYDYAAFSISDGPCALEVTRRDRKPIGKFGISPMKLNIVGTISDATLSFTVKQPAYLIVEVDDLPKLVIAIDSPETDKPAASGPGIFNITAAPYSADPSAATDSTAAIQRAVDDAGKNGASGAIVYVPAGSYKLSELRLVSNVSLYLEAGAVLQCSGPREAFKIRYRKKSQNREGTWFIYTDDEATNVRIFGRGTIDGDGKEMIARLNLSNHLVVPLHCSNFTIDGVILRDSGLWGTVIANSTNVTLRHTKHFNHLDLGEDDCIDVCNSQNVRIEHSIAISLDDPYSTKTWSPQTDLTKQWPGKAQDNRDIVIDDCVAWTRCFAFKIGAGVWSNQENITIRDGVVYDSAHAIGISHSYGGGDVKNVLFDSIDVERNTMENLGSSWARIVIDPRKPDGGEPGRIFGVCARNINVCDAGTKPVAIEGLSEAKGIDGVRFENIRMPGRDTPASTLAEIGVKQSRFAKGVTIQGGEGR